MLDYIYGSDSNVRLNYVRLVIFTLSPFVVVIISLVFWCCKGLIRKQSREEQMDKSMATIAIIWFLFYPTLVSLLAGSINCTPIEGVTRLYDDLGEICFEGDHLHIMLFVSIPGLIIWAFGMPFLGFVQIKRQRKQLEDAEFMSKFSVYQNLENRHTLRLGFLTQGYKSEFYYWEIF